jgi:hypothetical protein
MSTDNRTELNSCDSVTGWTSDSSPATDNSTGSFYQGSASITDQASNTAWEAYTTNDTATSTTFNINMNSVTVYMMVKDNLVETFANGGVQLEIGDGTNRIAYNVGGNNAVGLSVSPFFNTYKLDVSVIVATPGSFTAQAGSEASLNQGAITQVGFGTIHLAKAVGSVDNLKIDNFKYVANGSYALTINGGSSGTPISMATVKTADVSGGWGMISNPLGTQYGFFAPTQWGNPSTVADHYFSASNEQWYWIGDNSGGHAVGTGNFPFRLVSNATDTGSFVISNVVIVNTGTGADFDASDTNFETIQIDGCTMIGLASFSTPSSGGTSRYCTNTIFSSCGQITANGADMTGCSVSGYEGTSDTGALVWDISTNPNSILDDMTFTKGTASTHGIEFGTSSPTSMTLNGLTFSGYNGSDGQTDSAIYFARTSGTVTVNLSNMSTPTYKSAGATITFVAAVTVTLTGLQDGTEVRVYDAGDGSVIDGIESTSGGSFAFSDQAGNVVYIRIFHIDYEPADITNYTIPGSATSVPIQQRFDRNYSNP